jgi:hypothetical protein
MSLFRRRPVRVPIPQDLSDNDPGQRPPGDPATDAARPRRREMATQTPQGIDADFCYREDERG